MLASYIQNAFLRFRLGAESGQEDVLQEVLLAVHVKRHTYDSKQFFLPWLYAIARYKLIDYLRKNKVRSEVPLEDDLNSELENVEAMMPLDSHADVDIEALCEFLPEKQKTVLKLVKLEGLSVEEAAQRTGYSPSDIKVTVHRAMKSLQEKVQKEAHENR